MSSRERPDDVFLRTNKTDIDGVAGNPLLRGRDHVTNFNHPVSIVKNPNLGDDEIGKQQVCEQHGNQGTHRHAGFRAMTHRNSPTPKDCQGGSYAEHAAETSRICFGSNCHRPLLADIVEKVRNHGWPKCPPFHVLSECCRSMRSQFGYAPHTPLDRKIVWSPKSTSKIDLYGPPKNQTLWKTDFFNNIGAKWPLVALHNTAYFRSSSATTKPHPSMASPTHTSKSRQIL